MASLVKRLEARLMDPQLNENFNKRVVKTLDITTEEKDKYTSAREAYEKYKENKLN